MGYHLVEGYTWAFDQDYIAGQNYVQYNQGDTLRLYKATLSTSERVRQVVDVQCMNNRILGRQLRPKVVPLYRHGQRPHSPP